MPSDGGFAFGPYLLDPQSRRLLRDGALVPLRVSEFDVLHALVRADGRTLAKEQLIHAVWGNRDVTDNSLTQAVWQLRRQLDPAHTQSHIETVGHRGYRFIVPVERRHAALTAAEVDALVAPHRAWIDGRSALLTLRRPDLERARIVFERLVGHDPANPEYRVGLANAHAMGYEATRADDAPDNASLDQAVTHAREARRLNPHYAEAAATLGFVLERAGDRDEAHTLLRVAVNMQPTNWRIQFRRGYGTWGQERIDAAGATLKYLPDFVLARVLMATVWVARGVLDEAEREIDAGIGSAARADRAPAEYSVVALHYVKGLLCLARGDIAEALSAFGSELALEPNGHLYARECAANTWSAIGACRLRHGDRDAARAAFGEAIARVARHPGAHAGLVILDRRPDSGEGDTAAFGVPCSVDHAVARASVLVASGQPAAAAALVRGALDAAPPGSAGWTIPIDPLLGVQQAPGAWQDVLATLRARAR